MTAMIRASRCRTSRATSSVSTESRERVLVLPPFAKTKNRPPTCQVDGLQLLRLAGTEAPALTGTAATDPIN
jgi:hypothetical protein